MNCWAENNSVYINFINNEHSNGFQKLQVIGSICHLTAEIEYPANDPFGNWNYNAFPRFYTEIRQFVIDFPTGKIYDFNSGNMDMLLKKDEALHEEFSALSKRKKEETLFVYLRKFNEKHPVYFPE